MTSDRATAGAGRNKLGLLIAAGVLAAIWLSSLALLALRTANPVTVNRAQLLEADAVVVATPQPVKKGHVASLRVERSLAGSDLPVTLDVGGIERERFSRAVPYLVPLRRTENGYVVTPAPTALNSEPLVYPATDEAVRVAEVILNTRTAKPYE